MGGTIARTGMFAGWLSLLGIFGYHMSLSILAGQRVSGTTDVASITAYYRQTIIAAASPVMFLVLVAMLVFAFALRETLAVATPRARFLATLGLAFVIVEAPALLAQTALEAALVTVATAGGDVLGLFRFWDVLYNSGAYVLEAAWVASFGLAMRDVAAFPRWLPRFSYVLAGVLLVNMSAIWIGIPDVATLPGNMLLAVWFAGASVGLGRLVTARAPFAATVPA